MALNLTSKQTRNLSYIKTLQDISDSQRAVYDVIKQYGPIHDTAIAKILGWSINRVTPRRNELAGQFIHPCGNTVNEDTNRTVCLWRVV